MSNWKVPDGPITPEAMGFERTSTMHWRHRPSQWQLVCWNHPPPAYWVLRASGGMDYQSPPILTLEEVQAKWVALLLSDFNLEILI